MTEHTKPGTKVAGSELAGSELAGSEPGARRADEHHEAEVVVVGGGAAGVSAALMLARARRRVIVVDAGAPRNAPAAAVHGLLGHEGVSPHELLARGRAEAAGYGAEFVAATAAAVSGSLDDFTVTLAEGGAVHARRLLIATGLVDELPDIPGVAERWGRDVLHCPYCHGWEVADQRLVVVASGPMSVHQALLFTQWSPDVTLLSNGIELAGEDVARLEAVGARVVEGAVDAVEVANDALTGVRLSDGRVVPADAVVVGPRMHARVDLFAPLSISAAPHPMGSFIEVDATQTTAVPGVWAAGNSSDLAAQVSHAIADGARAAAHINADLVMKDADDAMAAVRL